MQGIQMLDNQECNLKQRRFQSGMHLTNAYSGVYIQEKKGGRDRVSVTLFPVLLIAKHVRSNK